MFSSRVDYIYRMISGQRFNLCVWIFTWVSNPWQPVVHIKQDQHSLHPGDVHPRKIGYFNVPSGYLT